MTTVTAAAIHEELTKFLTSLGLTEAVLRDQLVGFCSDGASCMIGQFSGVATLLKDKCPLLKIFHCMAHRLELAVKNAVDTVNVTSYFRPFVGELYKVYSMSPKNRNELQAVANDLSIELLKVQKVFDVRWAFSSYVSVRSVLRDYPALFQHFSEIADGASTRSSKEKSKYRGLAKKLQSWFVVSEACILKDALRCLKQLSLYMQKQQCHCDACHGPRRHFTEQTACSEGGQWADS